MSDLSAIRTVADEMRKEAKDCRGDTLVSMSEGVANTLIARELEKWAKRLDVVVDDIQSGSE
jgi:hypothetical protein